jgi:hypothetical protein
MPGPASSGERITIARLLCATAFVALALYFLRYAQGDAWPVVWPIVFACVGAAIGVTFRGEDGAMVGAAVTGCLIPAVVIMLFAALMAIFVFYVLWTGRPVGGLGS